MAAVPNSYGKRYGHISRVQKILTESTATRTELAVAQKQQEEFHVKEALLRRQQNAYHDQGHIKEMEEELEQKLRTIPSVSQRQSDCERLHSTASETFTRLAGISVSVFHLRVSSVLMSSPAQSGQSVLEDTDCQCRREASSQRGGTRLLAGASL